MKSIYRNEFHFWDQEENYPWKKVMIGTKSN